MGISDCRRKGTSTVIPLQIVITNRNSYLEYVQSMDCGSQTRSMSTDPVNHRRGTIGTISTHYPKIDFILTRMEHRRNATDAKAIPNAGLDTDHRPVILYARTQSRPGHRPSSSHPMR
ncbi:hypothetical protein LSAT2_018393 [Lamellibrachia satsuma]|nr:hypothetical protein LSAT2_018393 [Lamellibrachia satsuma]